LDPSLKECFLGFSIGVVSAIGEIRDASCFDCLPLPPLMK
jgi:hypothetical protein